MESINIILKALERRLNVASDSYFCPKLSIYNTQFNAIKRYTMEIWKIESYQKTLIVVETIAHNSTTEEEKQNAKKEIEIKTIESLLKYFGI